MNDHEPRKKRCPACNAVNQIDETRCFLCDREFGAAADPARSTKKVGRRDQPDSSYPREPITLSDIVGSFFLVAWIVFNLGVFYLFPGAGIVLALIVVPALVRTLIVIGRRKSLKQSTDLFDKAIILFVSVIATVGVLMLAAVAFFALLYLICSM